MYFDPIELKRLDCDGEWYVVKGYPFTIYINMADDSSYIQKWQIAINGKWTDDIFFTKRGAIRSVQCIIKKWRQTGELPSAKVKTETVREDDYRTKHHKRKSFVRVAEIGLKPVDDAEETVTTLDEVRGLIDGL